MEIWQSAAALPSPEMEEKLLTLIDEIHAELLLPGKDAVATTGFWPVKIRLKEVTPEETHKISLETARRIWGRDYEIVVTTHLNTDNLHNHIVVNSVPFRTGRKFENHISDHYRLREISDAVCLEYGKSVLPPSKFTGSRKNDYWVKKSGNVTHRELLRRDMEKILPLCGNWEEFERRIRSLGYQFPRNRFYELRYTAYYKVKAYLLLQLEKKLNYEISHSKDTATVLVDVLFYMILQLLHLTRNEEQQRSDNQPHSPAIQQSITMEKQLTAEYSRTLSALCRRKSLYQKKSEEPGYHSVSGRNITAYSKKSAGHCMMVSSKCNARLLQKGVTMAKKVENNNEEKITALYCRLSVEDIKEDGKKGVDESNSIQNQKQILSDYARKNGYKNTMFFVDDGISGTSFERSDFQRMHRMTEEEKIGTIIVKDLSRFGREHIEGDRLAEIIYPTLGVTFISIHENINSATGDGMEMLPFYNIFNEWYAAQTSKKIRTVWQSKSDNGERASPTVAYGYKKIRKI